MTLQDPRDIPMTREAFLEAAEAIGVSIYDAENVFRLRCKELTELLYETRRRFYELRYEFTD
jgi:hypothetical protein